MKIDLGSGMNRIEGFIRIDDDPLVEPDYLINLDDVNIQLPFAENTIEEVRASHILEHIGEGFIPLMKELYRVCKHGAVIDITVPHHFHDVYYADPTHKRPITVGGMALFSKKTNREHIEKFGGASGLGLKYNIDFETIWYGFEYDPFYQNFINVMNTKREEGTITQEEWHMFERLMREANNVAQHTLIKLMVNKDDASH